MYICIYIYKLFLEEFLKLILGDVRGLNLTPLDLWKLPLYSLQRRHPHGCLKQVRIVFWPLTHGV